MIDEIFIKIEGLNLSRVVQKMVEHGLFISKLKLKKTYILFAISKKDLPKLQKILNQERKSFYIVKDTAIKCFFAKIPYFVGTFLPFCLLFAFFYKVYGTIENIKINIDSDKINTSEITEILSNKNILKGSSKHEISTQEIEKIILENTKNISGCSAVYEGRNLIINLFSAKEEDLNMPTELLSKYNAIVTEIDVFLGEPNVKLGDLVKQGDVLLFGKNGTKGEVKGKVYFSDCVIYNEIQDTLVETGNVFETESIKLSKFLELKKAEKCEFKNYKLEKYETNIVKNLFLPVIKENFVFKELEVKEIIVPFGNEEEKIKNELKQKVLAKLPEGVEAQNVTYSIVRDGTYVRVDCYVEVIMSLI